MDLQKICRLCSSKLHEPQNIFTTPGLLDKIAKFTDIQIRQGDGLPCFICDLCNMKLQISDKFRHQVGEADKLIRAFVMKQAKQPTDSRGLSFEKATLSNDSVPKWVEDGLRPQSSHSGGVSRERMRLFKRYNSHGFREGFSISSSIVSSDSEHDKGDERAIRFAAARRRLRCEKRNMQKYLTGKKSPKNITSRTVKDYDVGPTEQGFQDLISLRVPADPLNLLKVRRVQPLVDEDSDSSVDSFSGGFASRTVTWQGDDRTREAHGHRGFIEEFEDYSSSEYVPSNSNFSDGFRQSDSSSSSNSTIKINDYRTGRGFNRSAPIATPNAENTKHVGAPENQGSGTQCPVCERICVSVRGVKVHFWTHRSAKCQICEAPTDTKEEFRNHMQLHVKPIGSHAFFKCALCKMVFKTNTGLSIHMRTHSSSVPAIKQCPHCFRAFGTLRGFKIHMSKSHSGFESE